MPYLLDLADAARTSGLRVVEVYGWQTRGHGPMISVAAIIAHHTATPASAEGKPGSADRPIGYPSLKIVRDGREGLAGPLSQLGLGRDGTVYVIAAGRCSHAGLTHQSWQGNSYAIGIEAEHPGGTAPWLPVQREAYVALSAALAVHYSVPAAHVLGHKEIAKPTGRKTDPSFNMDQFRSQVSDWRPPQEDDMTPEESAQLERTDSRVLMSVQALGRIEATVLPGMQAQIKGLLGAVAAVNGGEPFDEAKLLAGIEAAAHAGTNAALDARIADAEVNLNITKES